MDITRRQLLKTAVGGAAGAVVVGMGFGSKPVFGKAPKGKVLRGTDTATICPYDATGCGFVVTTEDGKLINLEGDPDHPINRGGACAKGAGLSQIHNSDRRLSKVLYRRPGGTDWEDKSWDWAIDQIARKIKATRDSTWVSDDDQGFQVNRTDGIASVGGAALDNEECYLLVKALRAMGLVYIEHQARI